MSSSVVVETKTKPTPTSKVGVGFSTVGDKLILTTVSEAGLFGNSSLCPRQEVLSINWNPASGMSSSEAVAILASSADKITIRAGRGEESCVLDCMIVYSGGTVIKKPDIVFSDEQRRSVPLFLKTMRVSGRKWARIVEAFQHELIPALKQSMDMDEILAHEMSNYTQKQMNKGYIGMGQESHHEKKCLRMIEQAGISRSNVCLVASKQCVGQGEYASQSEWSHG